MNYKLGFNPETEEPKNEKNYKTHKTTTPRKSLVEVYFPHIMATYTYYNDAFDLKTWDVVFVDGKLEGYPGLVREIDYSLKMELEYYKNIISVADRDVKGAFSDYKLWLMTTDKNALPFEKARTWYLPPKKQEDFRYDNTEISLTDLLGMFNDDNYFFDAIEHTGCYLEIKNNKCRAIVRGKRCHELEFEIKPAEEEIFIKGLICDCHREEYCVHKRALFGIIYWLVENYVWEMNDKYIAVVDKKDFYGFIVENGMEKTIEIK